MNIALNKILIQAKKSAHSNIVGNNLTSKKGDGYDYAEFREYTSEDDVKNINWVVSSKMQKPYVKVTFVQKELNINIVSILNGSVFFGTKRFKQNIIAEVCAILGFSAVSQGDSYSSFLVNENIISHNKKSKKINSVDKMVKDILEYDPIGKKVDYKTIISKLFVQIKSKSLIYLVGDFFDISELDISMLSQKHEIIAFVIRDKYEETLDKNMQLQNFVDLQTGEVYEGSINNNTTKNYIKNIKQNDKKLFEHFKINNVRYIKIYTDEQPISKITELYAR